jgi:hypothetical protein
MRSSPRFSVLPMFFVMILAVAAVGLFAVGVASASDGETCGPSNHPSGKDRCEEPGGSGTQGEAASDPDDDGRGPERTNGGVDQDGGSGGVNQQDQDGNNGCGNDQDFEDDNEGLCKGRQGSGSAGGGGSPQSPEGPQGPKDDKGPQEGSPKDPQGPKSPQGPRDPQAPDGSQGPKSPQGSDGSQGPKSPQGSDGPQGPKSPQGPGGQQGPGGPQDPDGSTGNGDGLGHLATAPATGGGDVSGALPGTGGPAPAAPGPPVGLPSGPSQDGAMSGIDTAGQVFSPTPEVDMAIGLAAGSAAPPVLSGGVGQAAPAAPVDQLPATGANVAGGLLTALTTLGIGVAALRRGRVPAEPEPWLCS